MRIAILGATSQIAKDLVISLSEWPGDDMYLFARRPEEVIRWVVARGLSGRCSILGFADFAHGEYDAIINFVGAGDPARLAGMGANIFRVTMQFDDMALEYLRTHPVCRYVFLSSGAAYGSRFDEPAREDTPATLPLNTLSMGDWYGVSKLVAECRHRALSEQAIIDVRVFSYFSRSQDISTRFLMSDILRAIRDNTILRTAPGNVVRDYLHPADFAGMVRALLAAPAMNVPVDCYTLAPVDKQTLLETMQREFGLRYEVAGANTAVETAGTKLNYYSLNRRAGEYGYRPTLTSLEGIRREAAEIMALL